MSTLDTKLRRKEYIWKKLNLLTILEIVSINKRNHFRYKCDCWNIKTWWVTDIVKNKIKSCWCWNKASPHRQKHNMAHTKIYKVYHDIVRRCTDAKRKSYKDYWWRWIKCLRKSFEEFYKDMWVSYSEWLTIDRINNNWNYCKENCRRIPKSEQSKNRRMNIYYKWRYIKQWSDRLWVKPSTIYSKIRRGATAKEAINFYLNK